MHYIMLLTMILHDVREDHFVCCLCSMNMGVRWLRVCLICLMFFLIYVKDHSLVLMFQILLDLTIGKGKRGCNV